MMIGGRKMDRDRPHDRLQAKSRNTPRCESAQTKVYIKERERDKLVVLTAVC